MASNVWENDVYGFSEFSFGKYKLKIYGGFNYSLWLYEYNPDRSFSSKRICTLQSKTYEEAVKEATDIFFSRVAHERLG